MALSVFLPSRQGSQGSTSVTGDCASRNCTYFSDHLSASIIAGFFSAEQMCVFALSHKTTWKVKRLQNWAWGSVALSVNVWLSLIL